jgi:hypothetical protein
MAGNQSLLSSATLHSQPCNMADSVSADLNASHSALRFLFKNPKKWTQKHLDSLMIQDHEDPSVTAMVGEPNVPTSDDPGKF